MKKITPIWPFIFSKRGDPLYRKLRLVTIILLFYSLAVVIAQLFYDNIFEEFGIQNIGQFHLIFSFVISILVAFRVNASFSRWWEGRGQWGSLVNNSRNLALKFNNFIGLANNQQFLSYLANFAIIFKFHIRGEYDQCQKYLDSLGYNLPLKKHIPNQLIHEMYKIINRYRLDGKLSLEQYLAMDTHLANIVDVVGSCEKIVNTPIPTPFKIFVRQALIFYMIIFPFGWVEKFGFLIIPMIIIIVDVLLGLELVSEEIEDPFSAKIGTSAFSTKLNLDNIALAIKENVIEITTL